MGGAGRGTRVRNLFLLSIDGLSQSRFNVFREAMFELNELMHASACFRNFQAASTSGFQSFCDLVYGDSSELDHNVAYPSGRGCLRGRNRHLFALLRERGYDVHGMQIASPSPAYARDGFWGAWPEVCGGFRADLDLESFYSCLDACLDASEANGRPFAVYVSDRALMPGNRASGGVQMHPNFFAASRLLAEIPVGRIVAALKDRGQLENTVLVVFSNHGADFWTHGFYGGRTHAIDPYADLCWLPLFIYGQGVGAGIYDNLVSMVDLKPTLLSMLFPELAPEEPRTPFAGMNILGQKRLLAFSQSLFARQGDGRDPYRSLFKSYSVTDADQRLLVASDGGVKGRGGMELYYDMRDPGNTRNFLDFFRLDAGGNMTEFGRRDVNHVHFLQAFKPHLVMGIANAYNAMRRHLHDFIRAKEAAAVLDPARPQGETMPDSAFARKREKNIGKRY